MKWTLIYLIAFLSGSLVGPLSSFYLFRMGAPARIIQFPSPLFMTNLHEDSQLHPGGDENQETAVENNLKPFQDRPHKIHRRHIQTSAREKLRKKFLRKKEKERKARMIEKQQKISEKLSNPETKTNRKRQPKIFHEEGVVKPDGRETTNNASDGELVLRAVPIIPTKSKPKLHPLFIRNPGPTLPQKVAFAKPPEILNPDQNVTEKKKIPIPRALRKLYYELKNFTALEEIARYEDPMKELWRKVEVIRQYNDTEEYQDLNKMLDQINEQKRILGFEEVEAYFEEERSLIARYQEGMTEKEKYLNRLEELKDLQLIGKYHPEEDPENVELFSKFSRTLDKKKTKKQSAADKSKKALKKLSEFEDDETFEKYSLIRPSRLPEYQPTREEWLIHQMEGTVPEGYMKIPVPKKTIQIGENEFYTDDYAAPDYEYILEDNDDSHLREEDDFEYVDEEGPEDENHEQNVDDTRLNFTKDDKETAIVEGLFNSMNSMDDNPL